MKPAFVTKISPYTGNQLHTVEMVRKEVNGTGFPWKIVLWECQGCLRTHEAPYWCCPKCGGYAIFMTEEQFNGKRRQEDSKRREDRPKGGNGDVVCVPRGTDESRTPNACHVLYAGKLKHERKTKI